AASGSVGSAGRYATARTAGTRSRVGCGRCACARSPRTARDRRSSVRAKRDESQLATRAPRAVREQRVAVTPRAPFRDADLCLRDACVHGAAGEDGPQIEQPVAGDVETE